MESGSAGTQSGFASAGSFACSHSLGTLVLPALVAWHTGAGSYAQSPPVDCPGGTGAFLGGRGGITRPPSSAPGPSPVFTGLPLKVHEHDAPCALAIAQLSDAIPGAAAAVWQELPPQVHWSQLWSGGQLELLATLLVPSVPCPSTP